MTNELIHNINEVTCVMKALSDHEKRWIWQARILSIPAAQMEGDEPAEVRAYLKELWNELNDFFE